MKLCTLLTVGEGDILYILAQLGQGYASLLWDPLGGGITLAAVEGDVADDSQSIGQQGRGTVGGNGSPDLQIGVIDAFLGILVVMEYVLGNAQT